MDIRSQISFDISMVLVRAANQDQFEKSTSFTHLWLLDVSAFAEFVEVLFAVSILATFVGRGTLSGSHNLINILNRCI